jgi:hypothetical protein
MKSEIVLIKELRDRIDQITLVEIVCTAMLRREWDAAAKYLSDYLYELAPNLIRTEFIKRRNEDPEDPALINLHKIYCKCKVDKEVPRIWFIIVRNAASDLDMDFAKDQNSFHAKYYQKATVLAAKGDTVLIDRLIPFISHLLKIYQFQRIDSELI